MRILIACAAALMLAGCAGGGEKQDVASAQQMASPQQMTSTQAVASNNDPCAKSNWTRVRCDGNDSQCIQKQMDLIVQYHRCKAH